MMDDRDLLKMAAKAANIKVRGFFEDEASLQIKPGPGLPPAKWNPLACDADAFRLFVALEIKVMPYPIFATEKHSVIASRRWFAPPDDEENTYTGPEVVELYQGDPLAATRRAIVRAAAALATAPAA
jgi:hypothetical protein